LIGQSCQYNCSSPQQHTMRMYSVGGIKSLLSIVLLLADYNKEHLLASASPTAPGSCNSPNPLGEAHILVAFDGGTDLIDFGLDVRIDNKTLVTGIPFVIQAETSYTISLQVANDDDDTSFPFRGFLLRLAGDTVDARDYLSTTDDAVDPNVQEIDLCHTFFASGLGHRSNDLKRIVSGVLYVDEVVNGLTLEATVVIRNGAVRGSEFYLSSYTLNAVAAITTDAPVVAPASIAPVIPPMPVTTTTTTEAPVVVPSSAAPVTAIPASTTEAPFAVTSSAAPVTSMPVPTTEAPVAVPSSAAPVTSMPVPTTETTDSAAAPSSTAPVTSMPAATTDAPANAAPSSTAPVTAPMPVVTSAPTNMTSGALPPYGVSSIGMVVAAVLLIMLMV